MKDSILVTGGGSGIGLASSLALAGHGYQVYASFLTDDQPGQIRDAAAQHGVELHPVRLDVTEPESIRQAVDQVVTEGGGIYGLVQSAGLGMRGFFEDLSEDEIKRVYDVNVFGAMAVTREVLPHLRKAGRGRIALVTSAGGRIGTMTISAYGSGKFALEGFGESLAAEMAPFNIQVCMVEPGLVMTPHFAQHRGRAKGAVDPASPYYAWFLQHEHMVDTLLQKRRITPEDVGETVVRAMSARRPRLRYPVGRGPKLMFALRRYLPERLFEHLYFGKIIRTVTRPQHPVAELSHLTLPPPEESH